MNAPVGYQAAAVIVVGPPGALPAGPVGMARSRTLEHFPIQIGRRILVRLDGTGVSALVHQFHMGYFPEQAILNQLGGFLESLTPALLHAHLHHAIVLAGSLYHFLGRRNGVGDGLLNVHVLAGGACIHGNRAVPMVRGGHQHGVDVLALEDAPVVAVAVHLAAAAQLAEAGDGRVEPALEHIAGVHEYAVFMPEQESEVHGAAGTAADQPKLDPVVRAQNGARNRRCSRGSFQKRASILDFDSLQYTHSRSGPGDPGSHNLPPHPRSRLE